MGGGGKIRKLGRGDREKLLIFEKSCAAAVFTARAIFGMGSDNGFLKVHLFPPS